MPCFHGMYGCHPSMLQLFDEIRRAARLKAPVLIRGGTGSGKELVARALHDLSGRTGAFLAINAAALPDQLAESELFGAVKGAYTGAVSDRRGLIEATTRGTLYLDEAGDLPRQLQTKLLRTIEDGSFRPVGGTTDRRAEFGLIVSVQQSPAALVSEGRWREDFFYRVGGIVLHIPSLAERPSDIGMLVNYWLSQFGYPSLPAETVGQLASHRWPGNVRELKRAVERAVFGAQADTISAGDILAAALGLAAHKTRGRLIGERLTLRELERQHIEAVLQQTEFNAREAAERLGLSLRQLYRRLQALEIPPPRRRLAGLL